MRNLHSKILIEPEFLSKDTCDFIIDYIKSQEYIDLKVFDAELTNKTNKTQWVTNKNIRDTQTVDISIILPLLTEILQEAVLKIINPFFKVELKSSEYPQVLRYGINGHYHEHIDGEGKFNNNGVAEWHKTVDRDISILLYLNDDYAGGELSFPNQHITLNPKPGMLVAFPSSHHFIHSVIPITNGERFCIVTWGTL